MNDILGDARGPVLALAKNHVRSTVNGLFREYINRDSAVYGLNHFFDFNRETTFGQNPSNTFLEVTPIGGYLSGEHSAAPLF